MASCAHVYEVCVCAINGIQWHPAIVVVTAQRVGEDKADQITMDPISGESARARGHARVLSLLLPPPSLSPCPEPAREGSAPPAEAQGAATHSNNGSNG